MPNEEDDLIQPGTEDVQAEPEIEGAQDETTATPEIDAALGVDPAQLPPELEPHYKNMVRGMNRKMRELAAKMKEMEPLRQKAQAFDMVTAQPELLRDLVTRNGGAPQPKAPEKDDLDDVDPEKVVDEAGLKVIRRMIRDAIREKEGALTPVLSDLQGFVQEQKRSRLKSEWEALLDEYPEADDVKTDIAALMDRGLTLKQAFFALRGDEVLAGKKAQAVQAKKKAQLGRPGIPETGRKLVGPRRSLEDIIKGSWHQVQPQFAPSETE